MKYSPRRKRQSSLPFHRPEVRALATSAILRLCRAYLLKGADDSGLLPDLPDDVFVAHTIMLDHCKNLISQCHDSSGNLHSLPLAEMIGRQSSLIVEGSFRS